MKKLLAITLGLLLTASSMPAATWSFDKAHSEVGFRVKHMVIAKVSGQFHDFDGKINFDGENLKAASVEITIDAASIDTDNEDRDKHLRTGDFFLVDSFPTITFKSKRVVPGEDDEFKVIGDLTIRGVTKEVTLDAELNGVVNDPWGNTRAGFSATTEIDRQDFGVSWNNTLDTGGLVVGDDVEIMLEIEVIKDK
jgi:polyisoprenoid-binding protein YceI